MQAWAPNSSSYSFFGDLNFRELSGFRVRKTPYLGDLMSEAGVVMIEHEGQNSPPLAVSFCKTSRSSHILAVSDEEGYVSLYDTRRNLPSLATCREKAEQARLCEWIAHENAIFDICWMKNDTLILTASGDQTIKVWDVEKNACISLMKGHSGSVKSLSSNQANEDLIVSGSRDGSFALWDLRCKPSTRDRRAESRVCSTVMIKDAHKSPHRKRPKRGKAISMSITSVLYLKDGVSIASAGAEDSIVKFWDTRNLNSSIIQACPSFQPSIGKGHVLHGISSLSQDSSGMNIAASCMDNRIYLYDLLNLDKGPSKFFCGAKIASFYVKASISPDASHILSGSTDGNAYVWQMKRPEAAPVKLKGHGGEVTAVTWCSSEAGKLATSSDDFMVRIWNVKKESSLHTKSPVTPRKRVTAMPNVECRKLLMDKLPLSPTKAMNDLNPSEASVVVDQSPSQMAVSKFSTPVSGKRRMKDDSNVDDGLEMQNTPKVTSNSPDSVLNPPNSLKRRTIRDYFLAAS